MTVQKYQPGKIEKKWQKAWAEAEIFQAKDAPKAKKFYVLDMFPYPSGEGLHVGHPEGYTASDIYARFLRMKGFEVLHPMGWDAFGLPAENYAIKTGALPEETTKKNINNFKKQIQSLGFCYDWTREVNTSDPKYYKWTQWIFLQLFKHGLAYESFAPINWCPSCKTGLANEEVVNGKCERCGTQVVKKNIRQWLVKITDEKYIERLLNDLDKLDWPENIKSLQKNWIGRSEGALINFELSVKSQEPGENKLEAQSPKPLAIEVFTTRPDTLFGATYMVLAPEHPLVNKITTSDQKKAVEKYKQDAAKKSDLDRTDLAKEKSGVFTGAYAVNPVNNKKIPIWIADYVLASYGTGAIMAVPAHDERDHAFAKKFKLPIIEVVKCPEDAGKKHCVLVHGSPSKPDGLNDIPHSQRHWFGWLKKKLEEQGYSVDTPDMPVPWKPDYQAWKKEFEKIGITEDTILIGHSAGGAFVARWLSENKQNVKKLIMLSPGKTKDDDNIRLHDFYEFRINPDVAKRVDEIILFSSDNEKEYRKQSVREYHDAWNARVIELHHTGHFVLRDMGRQEFPELLEVVLFSKAFTGDGISINSGAFNGLETPEFKKKITVWLEKNRKGKAAVNYKLRDWVFSRQRYWGEPIPIVHCEKCGNVAVAEKDLPLELPKVKKYEPTGTGESPLAHIEKWVNTKCPRCGGPAKRETNTMPQWAGSNWYWLRYCDPHNNKELADPKKLKAWLPVDLYVGGAEHAVLHLLYARFIYKFLFDIGVVPKECGDEPFIKLKNQGLILAQDGQKMSKSRGNVVNPDEVIKEFGADAMRMYEMFMGPFEDVKPWNTKGIVGIQRFLGIEEGDRFINRVFSVIINAHKDACKGKLPTKNGFSKSIHKAIKKITEDIENFRFNTCISELMIFFNGKDGKPDWRPKLNEKGEWESVGPIRKAVDMGALHTFLKLLSPFAPHIAEELWEKLGHKTSILLEPWPEYDPKEIIKDSLSIAVQINGKVRDQLIVETGITEEEIKKLVLASAKVQKWIAGKELKMFRYVKGKIVSVVA